MTLRTRKYLRPTDAQMTMRMLTVLECFWCGLQKYPGEDRLKEGDPCPDETCKGSESKR